jgi:hypothetical protein
VTRPAIRYSSLYTARPPMLEARRLHVFGPLSKPRPVPLRTILSALVAIGALGVVCTVGTGVV